MQRVDAPSGRERHYKIRITSKGEKNAGLIKPMDSTDSSYLNAGQQQLQQPNIDLLFQNNK